MPPKVAKRDPDRNSNPDFAVTPDRSDLAALDHSFLLQLIGDIKQAVGKLEGKAEAEAISLDKLEKRILDSNGKLEQRIESLARETSEVKSDIKSGKAVIASMCGLLTVTIALLGAVLIPILLKILDAVKDFVVHK